MARMRTIQEVFCIDTLFSDSSCTGGDIGQSFALVLNFLHA